MSKSKARDLLYGEPWVAVPYALLVDPRLSAQAVRVWAAIASHLRPGGKGLFPGRERLADMCGCSVDTVKRAVGDLEASGWLKRDRRHKANGNFGTNVYTLCTPRGTDAPRSEGTGAPRPRGTGAPSEVEEVVSRNVRPNGRNRAAGVAAASGGSMDDFDDFLDAVDDEGIF